MNIIYESKRGTPTGSIDSHCLTRFSSFADIVVKDYEKFVSVCIRGFKYRES